MPEVDSKGVYRFEVLEGAVGTTRAPKNFPQWVSRLKAVEKYIEDAADIAHYQGQGLLADGQPGWVDWSSFGEEIMGYSVLFNSADSFVTEGPGKTSLKNYEQLQLALGWDGTEFESLADGSHVGKVILGRIEEDTYNGNTSLKLNWIDHKDAPPTRSLKSLDVDVLKGLSAKLKLGAPKKAVAPAKPAVAVGKPAPVKPAGAAAPASSTPSAPTAAGKPAVVKLPAAATPASSAAAPTTTQAPVPTSPSKKAPTPPPPAAAKEESTGFPAECDQMQAWEAVHSLKGDAADADKVIQEAWMAACAEVGGERGESLFTATDWAKIRDVVIRDCALAA